MQFQIFEPLPWQSRWLMSTWQVCGHFKSLFNNVLDPF
jgi:hypothetical protein